MSVKVWSDPWLSLTSQERPIGPVAEALQDTKVAELIDHITREWDREKIQLIAPFVEEKILLIKPSKSGAPDKLIWLRTPTGEYTTKSGYQTGLKDNQIILAPPTLPADFDWQRGVWNLHTAPKVKLFLWKVMNRAIPVGEQLLHRNIDVDPKCIRCGKTESINHFLLHCTFAKKAWELAPFKHSFDSSGLIDLANGWPLLCTLDTLPPPRD